MTDTVKAPWTPAQVRALDTWQREGEFHPYTCPQGHGSLIPTTDGWVCGSCDYTQDWAHAFSAGPADGIGDDVVEAVAEAMHDAYEAAASRSGWETNVASRKPWADVPESNKVATRASARAAALWFAAVLDDETLGEEARLIAGPGWFHGHVYNAAIAAVRARLRGAP